MDIEELNRYIKVVHFIPVLNKKYRSQVGSFATLFGYGILNIDITNLTVTCTRSHTLKCEENVINNVPFDITNFDNTQHMTFYYDSLNNNIKCINYHNYKTLPYLSFYSYIGSYWARSSVNPDGLFILILICQFMLIIKNKIMKIHNFGQTKK